MTLLRNIILIDHYGHADHDFIYTEIKDKKTIHCFFNYSKNNYKPYWHTYFKSLSVDKLVAILLSSVDSFIAFKISV